MSVSAPELKPMTAGDILDQAIRIYRHNFVPLVTIVAIVSVPVVLIQVALAAFVLPLSNNTSEPFLDGSLDGTLLLTLGSGFATLVGGILTLFQNGALSWYVSERFLGRPATVRQSYGKALRRWLALLLATLLLTLAIGGLTAILIGVAVIPIIGVSVLGASQDPAAALVGLAVLCLCILFIPALGFSLFLYTRWTFWTQTIVLENFNSTGGLGRSWKLTRGVFWRVLGFNIILYVLVTLFAAGPIYLVSFSAMFLPSLALALVLNSLASSLVIVIMTPLQYAVLTILFYDLKIRKEGFDLQLQMQAQAPLTLPPLYSGPSQ